MKKQDTDHFRQVLLDLHRRLSGNVESLSNAALGDNSSGYGDVFTSLPTHNADMGSDVYDRDSTLRLIETEEEMLADISVALERIDNGDYGSCAECGSRIPKMRLNVIPYTPYCVGCASEIQERNGARAAAPR